MDTKLIIKESEDYVQKNLQYEILKWDDIHINRRPYTEGMQNNARIMYEMMHNRDVNCKFK